MKTLTTLLAALTLTGCASLGIGTIHQDAVGKLGKITDKETVINRVIEQSPVFYGGFGFYGHHGRGRWGYDPFYDWPMGYQSTVREDVSYQYRVLVNKTEKLTLQSPYNLEVGQCVTIWQIPDSNRRPRVDKNPDCQTAINPNTKP